MNDEVMLTCTRCGRTRRAKFMVKRKNYRGVLKVRCAKRSVCHSLAKRNNEDYRRAVTAHGKRAKRDS